MFATSGDEAVPTGPGPAPADNGRAALALVFVWVAQILGPICLLGYAYVRSFHLADADPLPQAQLDQAHVALVAFAVVILVVPVVGWVLAAGTKRAVQAWVFGVIFVAALVLDGGLYALDQRSKAPEPAPVVTQCIPRSDGGHGCPGG